MPEPVAPLAFDSKIAIGTAGTIQAHDKAHT
jgi:hypothetical protein